MAQIIQQKTSVASWLSKSRNCSVCIRAFFQKLLKTSEPSARSCRQGFPTAFTSVPLGFHPVAPLHTPFPIVKSEMRPLSWKPWKIRVKEVRKKDSWIQITGAWVGFEGKISSVYIKLSAQGTPFQLMKQKFTFKTPKGRSMSSSPTEKRSCLTRNNINNTSIIRKDRPLIKSHKSTAILFSQCDPQM